MQTIHVVETVSVPREALFGVLSDHEGYVRFPGIDGCRLLQLGTEHRNGVGAVRRVNLGGPVVLDEEIYEFTPGRSFSYRVVRSKPVPMTHEGGTLTFEDAGVGHTKVTWVSTFALDVPVVGGLLSWVTAKRMDGAFRGGIRAAARLAAGA